MKKILATGSDFLDEERAALYVSQGAGNLPGVPEVHIEALDPLTGRSVMLWVRKDELLAALNEGSN